MKQANASDKPKKEPQHKFQVEIPKRLWAKYKADCTLRGLTVRADIIAHIEGRVGKPSR